MKVSIIIPTLNEAAELRETLDAVCSMRPAAEVIVSDGGSTDATLEVARARGVRIVTGPKGRGAQLHLGACASAGEVLWFLPAGTRGPTHAVGDIINACFDSEIAGGNFAVAYDSRRWSAHFLNWLYSKLAQLGLRYGASGIFVRRGAYFAAGGFRPVAIFEDLDLARRLRWNGALISLAGPLVRSSRGLESRPFLPVFTRWAGLQVMYWLGSDPRHLGERPPRPQLRKPLLPKTRRTESRAAVTLPR